MDRKNSEDGKESENCNEIEDRKRRVISIAELVPQRMPRAVARADECV